MSKEQQDSKVSRSFLRMVIKELGKPVPEELKMNSWELVDIAIKEIHLLQLRVRNAEKLVKQLKREDEGRRQRTFSAIEEFFNQKVH